MAGPLLASLNELSKLHPAREGGEPPLARAVLRHGDACECLSVGRLSLPLPSLPIFFLFFFSSSFRDNAGTSRSITRRKRMGK
ncbi:hypothetical protein HDV62DRAFT_6642 [Trichoderma sp. SZMC 28011]